MKKAILMKTIFLLWALIAGGGGTQAAVYEWVKVNDLSEVNTGDQVILVDVDKKIALSSEHGSQTGMVFSTPVTISDDRIANAPEKNRWTLTMPYDEYENKSYYSFEGLHEPGYEGQQGGKLYGVFENGDHFYDVSYANTDPYTYTTYFDFVDYGSNGGKLYYTHSGYDYYLKFEKSGNGYRAYANPDKNSGSNITLFKRVKLTFVKWKRVQDPANLATGDTTVIVDLASSNAMKNNPAYEEGKTVSKDAPSAMKVTLKEELDRLTCEIGDTLEWKADRSGGNYQFYIKNGEDYHHLFNSDQALRVGYVDDENPAKRIFDLDKNLLHQRVKTGSNKYTHYHVGFKQASGVQAFMGGSTWDLGAQTDDGKVNADIAATKLAFFKKVRTDKPDPTLRFPGHDYEADVQKASEFVSPTATVAEAGAGTIKYWSGNTNLATVDAITGQVTLKGKRGTVRIYAQLDASADYDDYLTSYILRIDDTSKKGSRVDPFTVAEAIAYAKATDHEEETTNGTCYFVKGIVSSVGGMMAGMEDMEDMMGMFSGMMEGMGSSTGGFDMSSLFSMFMGEQEEGTVTYAISDNGVDRDSLSVINGRGLKLADITADSLSVGDWVTVYGPLEYSEDQDMMSMFGGMGGNNNNNNTEDKRTVKMPRVNYMQEHTRNLITETVILYYGETKQAEDLFTITNKFGGTLVTPTNAGNKEKPMTSLKLSDTDFAEWVLNEEKTDSVLVPKMEGIITVTVKAPVMLQEGDTVKMKRKFYLDVRDRRVLPAGAMEGVYELVTNANQLKKDDKLLIVATIDDKPKVLNRKVGGTGGSGIMSMFGGSGNSSNITIDEDGKITQVPDDAMILNLEQTDGKWSLQTGRTADFKMTYLYISDTDGGGFGGGSIPGMGGGAKLKTGKLENISDSCQVTFTFPENKNDSVQIKFNFADREKDGNTTVAKNVIRYGKSMMSSSFGGYEADSEKATLPRLYRLVHPESFDVTIDDSGWTTIVPYTDVTMPDGLEAFIVAKVEEIQGEKEAVISHVAALKGGEPYLLHKENGGTFALTVSGEEVAKPRVNKLQISDESAEVVYVLAQENSEVGFKVKNDEILAAGYVYLPYELGAGQEFIPFEINDDPFPGITTGISDANGKGTVPDRAYDLQGRRVSVTKGQVKKGLYIVNGKKIVVK